MKRRSRNKKKLILGITGGWGSGKTTVARIFKSFSVEIIDADKIAHQVTRPQTKIYKKIIRTFGGDILKEDKTIDRDKLGRIVFANRKLLKRLNKIVHPEVIRIIREKIKASSKGIIALDAPLLIEAGLEKLVDELIVVNITRKRQIERIQRKTGLSRPDILRRIKAQIPLSDKVRRADFVIDNSGTAEKTKKQAKEIAKRLSLASDS